MKNSQVKVGSLYRARSCGHMVDVLITAVIERAPYTNQRTGYHIRGKTEYAAINQRTFRRVTLSAAKLRYEVDDQIIQRRRELARENPALPEERVHSWALATILQEQMSVTCPSVRREFVPDYSI